MNYQRISKCMQLAFESINQNVTEWEKSKQWHTNSGYLSTLLKHIILKYVVLHGSLVPVFLRNNISRYVCMNNAGRIGKYFMGGPFTHMHINEGLHFLQF